MNLKTAVSPRKARKTRNIPLILAINLLDGGLRFGISLKFFVSFVDEMLFLVLKGSEPEVSPENKFIKQRII